MGNSTSSASRRITDADKAILDLKALRRKLEGQKRRIDGLIEKEEKVARELLAGGKRDRAKLALKRKRLQQGALEKYEAWSFHVEGVITEIEERGSLIQVVSALKQGNEALKSLQAGVSLEDVEQLKEDTAEARYYQRELEQLLENSQEEVDCTEEMEALEQLMILEEKEQLPTVPIKAAKETRAEQERKIEHQEHALLA